MRMSENARRNERQSYWLKQIRGNRHYSIRNGKTRKITP